MTFKNWIFNKWHRVKRVRSKGARNVGKMFYRGQSVICKYDWSKKFVWTTENFKWLEPITR